MSGRIVVSVDVDHQGAQGDGKQQYFLFTVLALTKRCAAVVELRDAPGSGAVRFESEGVSEEDNRFMAAAVGAFEEHTGQERVFTASRKRGDVDA